MRSFLSFLLAARAGYNTFVGQIYLVCGPDITHLWAGYNMFVGRIQHVCGPDITRLWAGSGSWVVHCIVFKYLYSAPQQP